MRVLSKGFAKLKLMLPWVPPDTKLSKLDTLRLATSYISHLQRVLDDNGDEYSSGNDTKYQTPSLVRNLLFLTVSSTFAVTYRIDIFRSRKIYFCPFYFVPKNSCHNRKRPIGVEPSLWASMNCEFFVGASFLR